MHLWIVTLRTVHSLAQTNPFMNPKHCWNILLFRTVEQYLLVIKPPLIQSVFGLNRLQTETFYTLFMQGIILYTCMQPQHVDRYKTMDNQYSEQCLKIITSIKFTFKVKRKRYGNYEGCPLRMQQITVFTTLVLPTLLWKDDTGMSPWTNVLI